MKLTLNTKRIVFLGFAFFVLGALLFLSGMVVGSGVTPDMPDAQVARASNAINPALPVENIKEPDLLLKVPEMTSEQEPTEAEKSPAPKSDSAETKPPESPEKPASKQNEKNEKAETAETESPQPSDPKPGDTTETAQAEPPVSAAPEAEKPAAEDSKKDPASAPAPAPAPENSVAASPKVPDRPSFTIQVGAFLDKKNAEILAGTLKERGYSPYILTMWDMMKRQWHIVRLGDYPTQDAAETTARDFMMKERMVAAVRGVGLL